MNSRHCLLPALLVGAATLPGCISPQNDRLVIDQALQLESFQPTPAASSVETTQTSVALAQPSLTGLDRSNWAKVALDVPVDGTAHNPTYTKRILWTDKTARQRGEYPTALTALDLTNDSEGQQQLEAPANWLISIGDLLLLPFRVFWQAPWSTRWSPDEAYGRYWHPERQNPAVTPGTMESPFAEPMHAPVSTPPPPAMPPSGPVMK